MKPIHQTKFDTEGNCFAACVASLLELSLESLPNFCVEKDWPQNFENWCLQKNLRYLEMKFCQDITPPNIYCIITGPSPRSKNLDHCVIGLGEKIIHDPHPDNTGLRGTKPFWSFGYFTIEDPAKLLNLF